MFSEKGQVTNILGLQALWSLLQFIGKEETFLHPSRFFQMV